MQLWQKKQLAKFSQERLDIIVEGMLDTIVLHLEELAFMSHEETGYGKAEDKVAKNYFICESIRQQIRNMKCVGFIEEDPDNLTAKVGVPLGVIAALVPSTNPVSTTIFNAVTAIKAGNAIIFSPHPRAKKTVGRTTRYINQGGLRVWNAGAWDSLSACGGQRGNQYFDSAS